MKVKYDKETDALTIIFIERDIKESEYLEKEGLIIDFDEKNNLVGIEVLSVSKKWPLGELSKLYYEPLGI